MSQKQILQQKTKQTFQVTELLEIDVQKHIGLEIAKETGEINQVLQQTTELQIDLMNQIMNDQETFDSIEHHLINSRINVQEGNQKLDSSLTNTPSYINPFKNITNIISLLTGSFWKKN